jgi:hypothetical protein
VSDLPPPPPPPNFAPPPGYVPYGGGHQGAFQPTQPIRGLSRWLNVLLIASAALSAVLLLATVLLIGPAGDLDDGRIGLSEFDDELGFFLIAAGLTAIVGLATLVILIIWTFRLGKNLAAMGRVGQSLSKPGATIAINILGGCTLNILNFLMWREIWKGSDPDTPQHDQSWKQRPVAPIVTAWFVASICGAVFGFAAAGARGFGGGFGNSTDDLADQFTDQLPMTVIQYGAGMVASILFILLTRQLAARHMRATGESAG